MDEVELPDVNELKEHRENTFTKRVALCTAIFAVMLAVCSLGGNNSMKDMLLAQQQASDQWSFYQSKVMREHLYRIEKNRLEAEILDRTSGMKPETIKHFQSLKKSAADEEARYHAEKKEIENEARKLDTERDINRAKDPYFDYGEVMLQIAIVMSSISIISLSRSVFRFAIVAACTGAVLTLNGYLMFFRIPFFH
ncbi:MAG TPA: DUF4337 domain-containing protein [Dissulfurispiraceae bacterium]|nr:DUF4337 domain-containing protein [Dissulfurispiraceae bacterium]